MHGRKVLCNFGASEGRRSDIGREQVGNKKQQVMTQRKKYGIRLWSMAIVTAALASCSMQETTSNEPENPSTNKDKVEKLIEWKYKKHDLDTTWMKHDRLNTSLKE